MAEPKPQRGFKTPPEVTSYFSEKGLRPAFSWQDVWGQEHAYAFTVAKATELELLTAFKTSIGKALSEGRGFETWRAGMLDELRRLGWAGPRTVTDPTGKWGPTEVDFSNPRRLQTIFWSNVNTARSAGQWERAQRTKAGLPFALYVRTASTDPRKEHLGWVGTILPLDDAWWSTHWPPNGWGYQKTGLGEARTRFEALTFPHVIGGLDAVAWLQRHHEGEEVVNYYRLRGQYLGRNQGRVRIRHLFIDETKLHPFDGVGRRVGVELDLVYVGDVG